MLAPLTANIRCKLPRQFHHHMFAVFVPLPPQRFDPDAAPDAPVKLGELGIVRSGHLMANCIGQMVHFNQQGLEGNTGKVTLQFTRV